MTSNDNGTRQPAAAEAATLWDYIFVGGGLSASVAANRLAEADNSLKILLVEAGGDASKDPTLVYPSSAAHVGGEYDWKYKTVPQAHLNERILDLGCGKGLGGGTIINVSGWSRGAKYDFDEWGSLAGDSRWSYNGLLPYFRKLESYDSGTFDAQQHGDRGPIHIQTVVNSRREYPLRQTVLESWRAIGLDAVANLDGNAGNPVGVADLQENRKRGRRTIASVAYPLDSVTVKTNTTVAKVIIGKSPTGDDNALRATGIKLSDGAEIKGKEVILSAGAIRSPQLLMLSGVGPKQELAKQNIDVLLDHPHVGKNFIDHSLIRAVWKVKDPSEGYMPGSGNPLFKEPQYSWGVPADFIVTSDIKDKEGLAKAIEADEGKKPDSSHPLLKDGRVFNEFIPLYAGSADGSRMTVTMINLNPTSRGTVTLSSSDISDPPLIDPNYHATAVDRFVTKHGIRMHVDFTGSKTRLGREVLDGEAPPAGFDEPLTEASSDSYITDRVCAGLHWHPMGSLAMGKVVDSSLRVIGVSNLRVVDASVYPNSITAHIQLATYAMAHQAADIIFSQRAQGS